MRLLNCILLLCVNFFSLYAETSPTGKRSLNDIFPRLPSDVREAAFSNAGYYHSYSTASRQNINSSGSALDVQIIDAVFSRKPGFLVESILVIPDTEGRYSLLDAYNALGKTRGLKGRVYHSHTRNEYIALFDDVTRLESAKKNVPVNDPLPASKIPDSETIYMRLNDVNFKQTFYRADITQVRYGLRYSLTNNKNMTYFLIPVIREEKFTAQLYFEPITEGILIYSLAGADVSDFVSSKIDMPSAITKRLAIIITWVAEGIKGY